MTQTITLAGVDRSSKVEREGLTLVEHAYLGEVGNGEAPIDDDAGTITVDAYKSATVVQTASTPSRIFSGFTHKVQIRRNPKHRLPAARRYSVTLLDGNDLLRRIKFHGDDAKRPKEPIGDRVAYILASGALAAQDFGAVTYPDELVDADRLHGKFPGDVFADLAKVVQFNYYVRWNVAEAAWELVFRDDNASTADTCTLSISNAGDADGALVYAPLEQDEPDLTLDPEDIYSDVFAAFKRKFIHERRTATATAYAERWGTTEDATTKEEATARRNARIFLHESKDPEQALPLMIKVDKEHVGLVQAGMRIPVCLTHMTPEGWGNHLDDEPRYARILRLTRTQPQNDDETYHLRMELSPQEDGPPAVTTGPVQMAFARGTQAGLTIGLPNPVAVGNKLVCLIITKLDEDPGPPNTSPGLPRMGAGLWDRMNGTDITAGQEAGSGLTAWWKEADSTESEVYISEQNPAVAIFELPASYDPGSATILGVDWTVSPTGTYDIGTQSPAAGEFAIAAWSLGAFNQPASMEWSAAPAAPVGHPVMPYQTTEPNPSVSAGWTLDYSKWVVDASFLGYVQPASPWAVFAHAEGDGSSLLARVTPGESGHPFGGLYIVIPT